MKLLITVIERGKGERVMEIMGEYKVDFSVNFLGSGTALPSMMEYFSLTDRSKDVVFSLVADSDTPLILEQLEKEFAITKNNTGSVLTINLNAINRIAYEHLLEKGTKNG
ncbi:MAG: hypothetical protein M0Q00_01540 [Acholeplasmataceae bacterium]|nr:hypothetical protein [Acholeplasmataceae bacterium]